MTNERVPADYGGMSMLEARRFDKMVRENFMPGIIATAKQVIEDYGVLEGVCVEVGSGTAVFAIELCRRSHLKIFALEKVEAINEVARRNIESEGLAGRIIPVLGDAHDLPFGNECAHLIISRGSYHCWHDKVRVFEEIYRILKKDGIGFVGGGFGRYVTDADLERMRDLRERSLKDDAEAYSAPNRLKEIIRKTGISHFHIIYDKTGLWSELRK
jgi:ubiquinone/menaquinone biosynthesis C-methylase UbiE